MAKEIEITISPCLKIKAVCFFFKLKINLKEKLASKITLLINTLICDKKKP